MTADDLSAWRLSTLDRIESLESETLIEKRAGVENLERWIDRSHEIRVLRAELDEIDAEIERKHHREPTLTYRGWSRA